VYIRPDVIKVTAVLLSLTEL